MHTQHVVFVCRGSRNQKSRSNGLKHLYTSRHNVSTITKTEGEDRGHHQSEGDYQSGSGEVKESVLSAVWMDDVICLKGYPTRNWGGTKRTFFFFF